ncbi:nuclease-related domain-containing protein [Pseudodesulfovibrio pelocollis]|uniref:nuclease-related domain-containing protein n=1 Tax=Pseudodesulfovibrio pelocollis TaxID=3051432 RepID=UPI00255ACC7C|nr:nuclease-related domain-containing protein [Pseudodesulfovibrio sp. SB368]
MDIIAIMAVVILGYIILRLFEGKPNFTDSSIVRSEEYISRLLSIHNGSITVSPARLVGWEGERDVLFLLEAVGKGIVYWNVGVRFRGQKCEYDILVLSPFGVLHVEVKAYAGTYVPAPGEPLQNPNNWEKVNPYTGEAKTTWSPVSQSLRANNILQQTLTVTCEKSITVQTVIVFPDKGFRVERMADSRLPWFNARNFQKFYRAFSHGLLNSPGLDLVDMVKIASVLGQCGFEPVFYDAELFKKDGA